MCLDRASKASPPAQLLPTSLDRTWPAVIIKVHKHIRDELNSVSTSNNVASVAQIEAEVDVKLAQRNSKRKH